MQAYMRRYNFGDLTEPRQRERLARWIVERPESRFSVLGLDSEAVIREIIDGPPTTGSALGVVFRAYAAKNGKPRWGDKRPAYYFFVDELNNLFPDAQFVNMVRDGRACVASLKRTPWFGHDPVPCMATWIMAIDSTQKSGAKIGPERFLDVRYEDLVTEPEAELQRVCDFLGERYEPEMAKPELIADRVNPSYYEQRDQISRGVYTDALQSWRDQLEPWEVATFERAAGDRLAAYGYAPVGTSDDVREDKVREVLAEYRRLRGDVARRRRRDARQLAAGDRPPGALLTAAQREAAARPVRRPPSAHLRRALRPLVRRLRPLTTRLRRPVDKDRQATTASEQVVENIEES